MRIEVCKNPQIRTASPKVGLQSQIQHLMRNMNLLRNLNPIMSSETLITLSLKWRSLTKR